MHSTFCPKKKTLIIMASKINFKTRITCPKSVEEKRCIFITLHPTLLYALYFFHAIYHSTFIFCVVQLYFYLSVLYNCTSWPPLTFFLFQLDPSRSNSSTISVLSLPDRFTVEWSNVSVMELAEHPSGGSFTFQVGSTLQGGLFFK